MKPRRIVLVGASVGRAWDIARLPDRTGLRGFVFEYVGLYQFDKSEVVSRLLATPSRRPDAIVIKECAAYFPGNVRSYLRLLGGWIDRCGEAGVVPVPATVAPVALPHTIAQRLRARVRRLQGRAGAEERLRGLLEYNDGVRLLCHERELAVLDLEAALRHGERDRSLRPELHSGDGLHLNAAAYRILDSLPGPALAAAFYGQRPSRASWAIEGPDATV